MYMYTNFVFIQIRNLIVVVDFSKNNNKITALVLAEAMLTQYSLYYCALSNFMSKFYAILTKPTI